MTDEATRDAVFRLRYRAYLAEGAIDPSPAGRFSDRYDMLDNHVLLGVFNRDTLVASVRIVIARICSGAANPLPEWLVFAKEITDLADGEIVAAANRLVVDPDADGIGAQFVSWAIKPYLHLHADVVRWRLAAVRRNHSPYYVRSLKANRLSGYLPYPGLKCEMALHAFDTFVHHAMYKDDICRRYRHLRLLRQDRGLLDEIESLLTERAAAI